MTSSRIATALIKEATSLGAQISLNELKRALDSTNKGKLPGWDESIEAADKAIPFLLCYFYYPWNPCTRQFINQRFDFCEPIFVVGNCLEISSDSHQYDRIYCGAGVQKDHENYMKILLKVGGILVMPIEDQLIQITRTGQCSWESKNILAVSFAPLVQKNRAEGSKPDAVELPPVTVRSLQDLSRVYIRRTLRDLTNEECPDKGLVQRAPQKRKRRRCRLRRINTYVFVGNQLIPQAMESEEDERIDQEQHKEDQEQQETQEQQEKEQEEEERDIGSVEILKAVNVLRDKIMTLPLPESLKTYLLYYREK
ncbi:protein-L-isoaspartate O-methyltransferase domain-containing protein 1 isoform X2 [Salmo trutta]|uniref:protein-L-isoaspartate O-methyltransferase domain-containing protein 1 isoform X2 n=1 Tax=Salmo trutta TaxID=8032 RepID=UPI0011304B38|nr:protein-L-isoaspartate O-methyltransferase domain-containing protein 1-like isoform X2 [Salmo trutta]